MPVFSVPRRSGPTVLLSTNKGYAIGYTGILRANLYQQSYGSAGPRIPAFSKPDSRLRDLTDRYRNTLATIRNSPVHQFSEDLSWIKGAHTVAFGGVTRLIHNNRQQSGDLIQRRAGQLRPAHGLGRCTESSLASDRRQHHALQTAVQRIYWEF